MLYWMCEKSGNPPSWPQLEHAIKRNFGGLESDELDPEKIFMDKLLCRREPPDLSGVKEEVQIIIKLLLCENSVPFVYIIHLSLIHI